MRDRVLWRKISRIIEALADRLGISTEEAMDIFYKSRVCSRIRDEHYALHLMSDQYIIDDVVEEIQAGNLIK